MTRPKQKTFRAMVTVTIRKTGKVQLDIVPEGHNAREYVYDHLILGRGVRIQDVRIASSAPGLDYVPIAPPGY